MMRSSCVRLVFVRAVVCGVVLGSSATAAIAAGADTFYGSYGESINIEVPPYHGVEPRLNLGYSSSSGTGFVGAGWELSGVPLIERAGPGRGAPTYTASDIYMLNGQELVACGGAVTSPGCSRGGNYTTKFESYTKIVFTSATNSWTLTQKDGSITTFEPTFTYGGFTFAWGVKTIVDTNNNTATYSWWCDSVGQTCSNVPAGCDPACVGGQSCYTDPYVGEVCTPCTACTGQSCTGNDNACYLDSISYGSNSVKLYRESMPNPVYFATGKSVGQLRYRLKSIDVKVGASRLKTYALAYSTSASSGRSMLTGVTQYGRDATVDAAGVVTNAATASKVPATSMAYSTSTTSLVSPITTIARSNDLSSDKVADFNGDGRDDLLVWHYKNLTTTDAPVGTYRYQLYLANSTGGFNAPIVTIARSYSTTADKIGDFNGDGKADLLVWHYRTNTTADNPVANYRYNLYLSNGNGFNTPITTIARSENTTGDHVGDFDGDGKDDLIVWNYRNYTTIDAPVANLRYNLYKSTGSGLASPIASNARSNDLSSDKTGDFNGDGKADLLIWHYKTLTTSDNPVGNYRYNLYHSDLSADVFATPITTIARSNSTTADKVGDFNGDGKADLLIWHYKNQTTTDAPIGNYRYNLYPSNGAGLSAPITTIARSNNTSGDHVADFNGDGRADLLVWHYLNYTTTDAPAGNYRYNLYLSDGYDLIAPVATIARAENLAGDHAGDFNGDGKQDLLVWNYRNYTTTDAPVGTTRYQVYKSGGSAVDLVNTLTTSLGGITTIAYTPSSNFANTNNPPIEQAVTAVTTNDGRGTVATTSYTYSGGLYDRLENRFLGFRYAKETDPCISGEATCPYTETWFKQDYGSASKPETVNVHDGAGKLLASSAFTYTTNGATVPHTSLESGRWQYVYDGTGTSCSAWPCTSGKRTYLARTYDTDGNVTQEVAHGDYEVTGDEVTTTSAYYKNTTAFLIGFPGLVMVYRGTSSAGTKLHETRLFYDQVTSHTTAPTKGLLRKESKWLNTDGSFVSSEYTYDAYGNMLTAKNPLGGITNKTYDTTYRTYPLTNTDPLGELTTTTFDYVCGKPLSSTLAGGRVVTMTYDNLCRETGSTSPGGSSSTHTYVNLGTPATQYNQVATPGPDGTTSWARQYFDGFGRTWRNESRGLAAGQELREEVVFDARGNVWKRSLPYFANQTPKWIVGTFDAQDRVTRTTNPDSSYQSTAYGLWSTTVTDELGRWTTRYFDGRGKVTEQREKLAASYVRTLYTYDDRGNPSTIVDDAGNVTSFTFDSLGRRTQTVDPDTGTTTFIHNGAGAETSRTDSRGKTTVTTYDAVGRVTQRVHGSGQAGSITVSFAYGQARTGYVNNGKLTTVTDPLGTQTLDYDLAGYLVRSTRIISGTSYTFSKGYDSGGRLKWTTYPDGDTVGTAASPLTYDALGNLKTIPGYLTTASYDASGRVTSFTLANGVVTTRAYDANRGWLNSISTVMGATTLQNLTYTRNNVGEVTTLASAKANESWTYAYDDLGQLTSATNTSSATHNQTFAYSKIGNITNNSRVGTYAYPATGTARPHAVSTAGGVAYAYDAAGNMTSGAGRTIAWDAAGRPLQVNSDTYGYDAVGERITKLEGGVTTHYLGDYEVLGSTITKYISIGNTRIAKKVGATKYYLHTDHLGSIQAVTDGAGVEIQRLVYRPYGQRLSTSTSHAQTRGFTGQTEDASGLTYLNARYYDSTLGRFISADPTMPSEGSIGLNRYAYAANNPVNQSDIDGLGLFKKIKKFFKKVKTVLKKIGQTLQKWAVAAAKIPVIGGIVALVLNTVGAALQGDWSTALRGAATLFIMYMTVVVSAWANGLIGGTGANMCWSNPGLRLAGRLAAQSAIYGSSGYLTARVQGASHAEALRAGITGAKVGFAMEAFSSFIEVTGLPGEAGTKADTGPRTPESWLGKKLEAARKWWSDLTAEGGPVFGPKALGGGAMRGAEKVFAYVHDHVQYGAAWILDAEALYPTNALGTDFAPGAVGGVKQFMIEWPVNIATLHLVQSAFEIAGDRVQARLTARGHSVLGYLANVTLNPFNAFSDPAEYGARMRIMRQMGL